MPFFETDKDVVPDPPCSLEQIEEAAFQFFRQQGFPYKQVPLHVAMQTVNDLSTMSRDKLMNTLLGYDVADTYHPHRFHTPVIRGAKKDGSLSLSKSQYDSWNLDQDLRKMLRMDLETGSISDRRPGMMALTNGTQSPSNFRPGFALFLYRKFCKPESVILDPCTGYGGRLVAFFASGCQRYIGIDPNTQTYESNVRMAQELGFADKVELHNLPVEDVDLEVVRDRCDFSFTSPPYFCKEYYSDQDTQSCNRYKTGESWYKGFLLPFMELQFVALKAGSYCCVNIADVKIGKDKYPLADWTKKAGQKVGFDFLGERGFQLGGLTMGVKDRKSQREPVFVFRK